MHCLEVFREPDLSRAARVLDSGEMAHTDSPCRSWDILLRTGNERLDLAAALDELERSSLVELVTADNFTRMNSSQFLSQHRCLGKRSS